MAKIENNYYFDAFAKGIFYANDAAALLQDSFDNFASLNLKKRLDEMHEIKHAADNIKHEMMKRLMKEFLPPIEREDIVELSRTIDDVTDAIEDVLLGMYMFHITTFRSEVMEFTRLISRCCTALKEMAQELPNFRKSTLLQKKIIEINGLEEEGDLLYTETMRHLYTAEKDPLTILSWMTMYDRLKKCCDCCEDVADMVEQVIMKNS